MRRLLVRRSLTGVGIYASVALGFLGTVVATHEFHSSRVFGDYATVIFAAGFLQSLFDLTVEEALVKYGFRYATREDWGRFRRLFASALRFKLAGSALGAIGLLVFSQLAPARLEVPSLLAAGIPIGQSLEGLAGSVLYLRSRYDLRSLLLAWSMVLRLAGIAVGAHFGLAEAIAGVLAAQVASTASIGVVGRIAFLRFPRADARPLGEDRREIGSFIVTSSAAAGVLAAQVASSASIGLVGRIAFLRFPRADARPLGEDRREIGSFIVQSSAATGVLALRGGLAPLLLGAVTSTTQVGLFRVAQAPQS